MTQQLREVSDPAAEAARKATRAAQRCSQWAARTAEQRAAEQAASTAARSAFKATAADEHARAEAGCTAARARQATRSATQTNGSFHFPMHPGHRAEWLRTAGMFFGLLTFPFVHSQPLWQDHLHVFQLEHIRLFRASASKHLNRQT